jgi:outer membrane receptor for ferrienterochelin and colicin
LFELGKKSGNHEWKVGLNQWVYDIDKFTTEGVVYKHTVRKNPQIIPGSEKYYIAEYHNGAENKTAVFACDKWNISDVITLNGGLRLEYLSLRGDFIDNNTIVAGIPYLDNKKTDIKKDWFNKAFMVSGIYKMTRNFGLLGEVNYNEQAGHLENYSAGNEPNLKKSKIPGGSFGVFYNHPFISLVSKATYIQRNEYRSTVNFTSASGAIARPTVSYDVQTFGWTTDVQSTPFKNFNLHVLFTLQAPKYKNYSGTVNFASTGESTDYDFNDKTVKGVSKILVEIDPSYQWDKVRIWGSARYFSKEYANLTNSLYFKGRWETFAGIDYKINKNFEINTSIVNLLNQRGAKGSISGADLFTETEAATMEGAILSGSYIRPFTVEFGLKYHF